MTKSEYVDSISRALSGRVSPALQQETVQYYREYIDEQIVKGTAEETVLASLGEPQLLAKSVIASAPQEGSVKASAHESSHQQSSFFAGTRLTKDRIILTLVIAVLVLLLIIGILFSALVKLLPVLIPVGIILFAVKKLKGK